MGTNSRDKWDGREVFTTGEAAEICSVSQQTIIRCFDSGRLQGFRVPGSRFRRIPRADLIRFMRANEIPIHALNGVHRRVLVVSPDEGLGGGMSRAAGDDSRLELSVVTGLFEAGMLAERHVPHVLVLDVDLGELDARAVIHRIRSVAELANVQVVVIGAAIRSDTADSLTIAGASLVLRKPIEPVALLAKLDELASS